MKDTKREYSFYEIYDRTHIERHLEDMAARGWLLEKMGNYGWAYRRIEPKKLHFSACYYPKASVFDPELSDGQLEFADFCAHTGWTLAATNGQLQAFYNGREDPVPIATDPAVELEAIHKSAKKSVLIAYGALLLMGLLNASSMLLTLLGDPIGFLARGSSLCAFCSALILILMGAVELCGYFLWRKRAKRAAEQGMFCPTPDCSLFAKACLALILLCFAGVMLSVIFSGRRMVQLVTGLLLIYLALLYAAVNGTRELLKRKKVSASVNRAATLGVDVVLGLLMMALLLLFAFRVVDLGIDEPDFAELPLTTEELTGEDYPEEWYFRSTSDQSSPLLAQYTAHQYASTHRIDAKEYHDLPGLDYTITDVRAAFLFDLCKNRLLHADDPEPIEQEYGYLNEYCPDDPAPWGAEEAWRFYWWKDEPLNRWLLVYGDRLVEIDLDWEPTTEQMATVGEKLGRSGSR